MIKEEIRSRLTDFLELGGCSPEEQEEIFLRVEDYLWFKLNTVLVSRLSEEEKLTFDNLSHPEEIKTFLDDKFPDIDEVMEKVAQEGIEEIKSIIGK